MVVEITFGEDGLQVSSYLYNILYSWYLVGYHVIQLMRKDHGEGLTLEM